LLNKVLKEFSQYGGEFDDQHLKKLGQFADQLYAQLALSK
jgi:hypothetical protein